MKQMFEILIPLTLIIVLLMCMMNNTDEDSFSIGGPCNIKEPFNVGGQLNLESTPKANSNTGNKQCKITMVWADWCGFSKKAKPEWDKLVAKYNNKEIDGCTVTFEDAEELKSYAHLKKIFEFSPPKIVGLIFFKNLSLAGSPKDNSGLVY